MGLGKDAETQQVRDRRWVVRFSGREALSAIRVVDAFLDGFGKHMQALDESG
jgi:hypothetical protein